MNLPSHILLSIAVESLLIVASVAFLNAPRTRPVLQWTGMMLLCLTFCWSVICGCVIALNDVSLRI